MKYYAPCPPGAEEFLEKELQDIGAGKVFRGSRGVGFEGDLKTAYSASLYSRLASRILWELDAGRADSEDELYTVARAIAWEEYFSSSATISCRVTGVPRNKDPRFATLRLKDAVVDRFSDISGKRPVVDRRDPDVRIEARWDGRQATIFLNWTGPPLHERGYRLERSEAALRETTAATILAMADWRSLADNRGAFVDPVCGSGTLLAEAAMMAVDAAPGIHRKKWGFVSFKIHEDSLWRGILNDAAIQFGESLEHLPPMIGFDIDPLAVKAARNNLRRAGLSRKIRVELWDIRSGKPEHWPASAAGLVCADPPYGHRTSENPGPVYTAIGSIFRSLDSQWRLALLAPDRKTASESYLRADRFFSTVSGGMDLVLGVYERRPTGKKEPVRKSVPDQFRPDPKAPSLKKALKRNLDALGAWAEKSGVTSYRIWDADLPEFNAAVDWYEGRWLHIQEFAAPAKVPKEKSRRRLDTLIYVLKELTGVGDDGIFLKQRERGIRPYSKRGSGAERMIVRENDARFFVNFVDYLDTGIFLDHRPTRGMIKARIGSGRFLNLFCYTGTATVMAALGGAKSTTSVDVSNTYLDWSRDNLRLNKVEGRSHRMARSDAMTWLESNTENFDLIFVDPPTYSNGAGRKDWSVQEDHGALIRSAMEHLSPGGLLIFSENFRRFELDPGLKKSFVVKEITRETLHPDFALRARAHRCWEFKLP